MVLFSLLPTELLNEYSFVIAIIMIFQVFPEMGLRPLILANKVSKVELDNIFCLRAFLALLSTIFIYWIVHDLLLLEITGIFVYLFSRPYLDFLHFSDAKGRINATVQYTLVAVLITSILKIYLALEWQSIFWVYLGVEGFITIILSYHNGFFYRLTIRRSIQNFIKHIPLIFSSFIVAFSNRLDVIFVRYVDESGVSIFSYSVMLSTGLYFVLTAFFLVDLSNVNKDNFLKVEPNVIIVLIFLVFVPVLIHTIHTTFFTRDFKGNLLFTILYSSNILLQLPLMRLSHIMMKELGVNAVFYKDLAFLILNIVVNIVFYSFFGLIGVVLGTLVSSFVNLLFWNYVLKQRK